MILSLTFRFLEQKFTVLPYWCVNVPNICMNRIIRRYDAGNYIFHKNCKTTLVWSLGTTMSDCCIVVWYDSLKNAIIIEKKSESNSLLFLFVVSIRLLLWSAGRAGASCWRMCQISYGFHCHVKLWNKKKILYKKLEQLFSRLEIWARIGIQLGAKEDHHFCFLKDFLYRIRFVYLVFNKLPRW